MMRRISLDGAWIGIEAMNMLQDRGLTGSVVRLDTSPGACKGTLRSVSLFPFPLVGFSFKWNISIGGVVIAQAAQVSQVVAEIDEIETRDPVSIYLLLMYQLVPEQRR